MNKLTRLTQGFNRNRALAFVPMLAMLAILSGVSSFAAVDTDLATLVTDATTLFGTVKTFVITVVVFIVGLAIVKMLRKK